MIDAIRRAARLGYKLTFIPSKSGTGLAVICREFPDRGPCSTAWNCPLDATPEDVALAVKMLVDSLFETIERLPDCPKPPKEPHDEN